MLENGNEIKSGSEDKFKGINYDTYDSYARAYFPGLNDFRGSRRFGLPL